MRNKIKKFIKETTGQDPNENTLLFKEGYLDSMGLLSLIEFINNQFNVHPTDKELIEENFKSINSICEYLKRKNNELE